MTRRMADRIQSLEREADAALDADMARLCRDALLGDAEAFEACREALDIRGLCDAYTSAGGTWL